MSLTYGSAGDAAKNVAVAVGISYTEYYLNSADLGMSAYTATSGTLSVVCGRISFTLGLKGPSVSIDTACSSSLVRCQTTPIRSIQCVCRNEPLFRFSTCLGWHHGLCLSPDVRQPQCQIAAYFVAMRRAPPVRVSHQI